jgi:hypothetical protein
MATFTPAKTSSAQSWLSTSVSRHGGGDLKITRLVTGEVYGLELHELFASSLL